MSALIVIVPVLIFITVALLAFALSAPQSSPLQERLKAYGYDVKKYSGGDLTQPFTARVLAPLLAWLAGLVRGLTPQKQRERAAARLYQAGQPMGVGAFLTLRFIVMVGLPIIALLPALLAGRLGWLNIIIALFLLYIGGRLPDIWLSFRISARQDKIRKSLPDAIDLITVCVEAGYGLEAAIDKVSERTSGPLTDELRRALAEIQLGKPRREALRDLSTRAGVPDLQSFIAAILQADQMGVSIAQVLRVQADAMRVRRQQRAEELARQAPVKMLFPLLLLIFPALMTVILAPAFIRIMGLFSTVGGR